MYIDRYIDSKTSSTLTFKLPAEIDWGIYLKHPPSVDNRKRS